MLTYTSPLLHICLLVRDCFLQEVISSRRLTLPGSDNLPAAGAAPAVAAAAAAAAVELTAKAVAAVAALAAALAAAGHCFAQITSQP